MSFELGKKVKIEVTGASHAPEITVRLCGIDAGIKIDMDDINEMLKRRAGGKSVYTTARSEADEPIIESGIIDGVTDGNDIFARFVNKNQRSKDYDNTRFVPRPSHADYAAYMKYNGDVDLKGGGFFSGRMTLPVCFAGAIAIQILRAKGIHIGAHISSVGDVSDERYDACNDDIAANAPGNLPVLNKEAGERMEEIMCAAHDDGDSIGGTIECKMTGVPVGLGDPIYDSVESVLSYNLFGIPAVKGIEFGAGFDISKMRGSSANDAFVIKNGAVRCESNNSGGIQGGITNGMPIIVRVAIKPTPSIYKEQKSVDLKSMTETTLKIEGRHDACIVPRAVPCVEAMCALTLLDLIEC